MKKLSLILVAAIMLVFASCDSGSKQYKELKSALKECEKAIDKAKNCDELETIYEGFDDNIDNMVDKYDEELSKEEGKAIEELLEQLDNKFDLRQEELCED